MKCGNSEMREALACGARAKNTSVLQCVLKTLACRGLPVGPSKFKVWHFIIGVVFWKLLRIKIVRNVATLEPIFRVDFVLKQETRTVFCTWSPQERRPLRNRKRKELFAEETKPSKEVKEQGKEDQDPLWSLVFWWLPWIHCGFLQGLSGHLPWVFQCLRQFDWPNHALSWLVSTDSPLDFYILVWQAYCGRKIWKASSREQASRTRSNSTAKKGIWITQSINKHLENSPAECTTKGNHLWDSGRKRQININNFSGDCPGGGSPRPGLCAVCGTECTKIARFSAVAAAIFTAPGKIARLLEAPRCAISSAKKIASEPRFFLRWKRVKMILAAEFPAIPLSAVKIASEQRRAILVHSVPP